MKKSNYLVLVTIFIVFFVLYLVQRNKAGLKTGQVKSFRLFNGELKSVKSLRLFKAKGGQVLLERGSDDNWVVASYFSSRGNNKKINDFLNSLKKVKGELRSDDGSVLSSYGLEDVEATHLEVKGEKLNLHFLVGTKKVDSRNSFVRMSDSSKVYYINNNLNTPLGLSDPSGEPKGDEWTELAVIPAALKLNRDAVEGLEVKFEKYSGSLERSFELPKDKDDKGNKSNAEQKKIIWKDAGKTLNTAKVNGLLGRILRINAARVVNPALAEKYEFKYFIKIKQAGRESSVLEIAGADEKYMIRLKGDRQLFEIDSSSILSGDDFESLE